MGRIVRYTSEELKKIPSINITALPNIIDDDIEFDASNDIPDDVSNYVVNCKETNSFKDAVKLAYKKYNDYQTSKIIDKFNNNNSVLINLKPETAKKIKSHKSWQTMLSKEIEKLVAGGVF